MNSKMEKDNCIHKKGIYVAFFDSFEYTEEEVLSMSESEIRLALVTDKSAYSMSLEDFENDINTGRDVEFMLEEHFIRFYTKK